jgi:hypothetical protein
LKWHGYLAYANDGGSYFSMEHPETADDAGAGGQMQVERAPKPARARKLALATNVVLMAVSPFWSFVGPPLGFPRPSVSLTAVMVGLPWVAVGMVWFLPGRFLFFATPKDGRLSLFGVLFFACLAPIGAYLYATVRSKAAGP